MLKYTRMKKKDFALLGHKRVLRLPFFDVYISKNTTDRPYIGVVVSKKVAKRSVDRHTIKRRIYAACQLGDINPYAFVFHPRATIMDVPFQEVAEDITKVLHS